MQKSIHTQEYKALIAWLKENREKRGLTMRELADKLDVSHSWIGKVEQLERRLDVYEYARLCECLEIKPEHGIKKLHKN